MVIGRPSEKVSGTGIFARRIVRASICADVNCVGQIDEKISAR